MFDKQNLAFTAIASRSLFHVNIYGIHILFTLYFLLFFPNEKYFLLDSLTHSLIIFKERVKNLFLIFFSL